uniref:Epoxide hydrolase n=1 Tax=Xenopsylla cheopis TaxID=163159 RepID=A0A6M2DF03_XENCH
MGKFCRMILFAIVAGSAVMYYQMTKELPKPDLPLDTWWGPGKPQKVDTSLRPFKINVNDKILETLKAKLSTVQYTQALEGINFEYGFNTDSLKNVVEFWKTQYNWREREALLNKYPHFKTNIQGLDIHYVHVKPKVAANVQVLPLIMIHGWPGSFVEFYKIIPKLTTPRPGYNFVFELILPSIPGYGFSQGAAKPGLGAAQVAVVMRNLMERIGFKKYYVQGGDWGALIISAMATLFPENILGQHSNMCAISTPSSTFKAMIGSFFPEWFAGKDHAHQMYPLGDHFLTLLEEMGYLHLQATKPDTVGVALRDSPAGLAAYILEKFSTWTNKSWRSTKDGSLQSKFSIAELLDNVMIYYVTDSITTSMRLYAESFTKAHFGLNLDRVRNYVPAACAKFPNELMYVTDCQLAEKYKTLLQSNDLPRGGHFAAFEEPELMAEDIFSAVKKFVNYHLEKANTKKTDL